MPDPIREFHRANAAGNAALFARAHNAGLVLGRRTQPTTGLDMPTKLERLHKYGVLARRRGQASDWSAACYAEKIVGNYEKGATLAFAQDCNRSTDTVENWAKAKVLYDALRFELRFRGVSEVRALRRVRKALDLYHFVEMAKLWNAHEIPLASVWEDLRTAYENNLTVRGLKQHVKGDNGDDDNDEPLPKVWAGRIAPNLKLLAETAYDNDPAIQRWAENGLGLFRAKGWLE